MGQEVPPLRQCEDGGWVGRGSGVERGWGMETAKSLASRGSAMTLENVCGVI